MRKLMVLCGCFICALAFLLGGAAVLAVSGKYNLKSQAVSYAAGTEAAVQAVSMVAEDEDDRQEGNVRFDEKNYRYNEGILTFLLMGIDREKREEAFDKSTAGGQADALFLLVLDAHKRAIRVIPIHPGTMTEITIYDEQGEQEGAVTAQICSQHSFGDGGKLSCEYQVKAVSRFFYGIPINGYLAVEMETLPTVLGLIDGINLEALEDVKDAGEGLSEEGRMDKQKQFLTELLVKVKELMKRDFTLPVKIYNKISDRAVTDITADEVAYLAMTAGSYYFDAGQVVTIPGRSSGGESSRESVHDAFYADEEALFELVLEVFYEPAG